MNFLQYFLLAGVVFIAVLVITSVDTTEVSDKVNAMYEQPLSPQQTTGYGKYHTYVHYYTCIDGLEYLMSRNYVSVSPHMNQDGTVVPCETALSTESQ